MVFSHRKHARTEREARRVFHVPNTGQKASFPTAFCERSREVPYQEARRAVAVVHLRRWLGLRRRLFATCAGVGGFGSRRKGALVTRHRPVPKVEAAIRKAGSSLSPWLFVLWATWDGEDFAGLGTGHAFWAVDLCDQSDRFHGSQVDERSQSSARKFGSVV